MHSTESVAWILFSLALLNLIRVWDDIRQGSDPLSVILAVWLFCYATVELLSVWFFGDWY